MNRVIQLVAITGALWAASVAPSGATTVNEGTDPASFSTTDIVKELKTSVVNIDDTYNFVLNGSYNFDLAGISFGLSSFSGTLNAIPITAAEFGTDFNVNLGPGSYALVLTGTTDVCSAEARNCPNAGYSGTATLSAAPLPSTWTMLIAGFLGLGFFAFRGTKKGSAGFSAR